MRKIFGYIGLMYILFAILVTLFSPSSSSTHGLWDYLGAISLGAYIISSVVVFLGMIIEGKGRKVFWPQANSVAFVTCILTYVFAIVAVAGTAATGVPLPLLENIAVTGLMVGCPIIIFLDWVLP